MNITKVTMTGADDSINPNALLQISEIYPFVEWGILISRKNFGANRFPSLSWLRELKAISRNLNLSCHLCGAYVTEFIKGDFQVKDELNSYWEMFSRVQINTHGRPHEWHAKPVFDFMTIDQNKEFIFQYDNVNTDLLESLSAMGAKNIAALFDLSHGAGLVPMEWPMPLTFAKCGYAGGLSPSNIIAQIKLIESKVGDCEIWIDMETHIRSDQDRKFDLEKVEEVLKKVENLHDLNPTHRSSR